MAASMLLQAKMMYIQIKCGSETPAFCELDLFLKEVNGLQQLT